MRDQRGENNYLCAEKYLDFFAKVGGNRTLEAVHESRHQTL